MGGDGRGGGGWENISHTKKDGKKSFGLLNIAKNHNNLRKYFFVQNNNMMYIVQSFLLDLEIG